MIKSISQWAFDPKRSLPEIFTLAQQHGFQGVELAVDESNGPLCLDITEAECHKIISQAAKCEIQITSLASGLGWGYPITSQDDQIRRRGIETTARSLEIARWLGLDALLLVPGGVGAEFIPGFQRTPYDIAYDNAKSAVQELAPIAEKHQVTLALENVWNKFLLSPLELRDFIDSIDSSYVGSYFDVGNVILIGYPEHWIPILGQRIKRVHFKDFKRSVGTLEGFCDLLDGDVDYTAIMTALKAIGYDSFVTAEYFDCEDKLASLSVAMDRILTLI